jgi:hypothetical protein
MRGVRAGVLVVSAGLLVALFAASPGIAPSRAATRARQAASPAWLTQINGWRRATGLKPVTNERAWDRGIEHHLVYLEKTSARYMTGKYASAHTENPASPYYTAAGAREAASSDLDEGGACTSSQALDIWLAAPFHAIGMLRAQLKEVALAVDPKRCYAGLDVIRGLDPLRPAATKPIIFPGPGTTTHLLQFGGETPDPTQTCGWQGQQVGLPLIVLLPRPPARSITASLQGPAGLESTGNHNLCVVDEYTFRTTDHVYGPSGAKILKVDNAVILIPRQPLESGSYSAQLKQPRRATISWSFSAASP